MISLSPMPGARAEYNALDKITWAASRFKFYFWFRRLVEKNADCEGGEWFKLHLLCLLLRPSFFFSFETGILVRSVLGRDLHCVTVGSELVALPLYSPPLALFGAVDAMGKKGNKTSAATKASAANGADSSSLALHGETLKMIQVCDSSRPCCRFYREGGQLAGLAGWRG